MFPINLIKIRESTYVYMYSFQSHIVCLLNFALSQLTTLTGCLARCLSGRANETKLLLHRLLLLLLLQLLLLSRLSSDILQFERKSPFFCDYFRTFLNETFWGRRKKGSLKMCVELRLSVLLCPIWHQVEKEEHARKTALNS